MKNIIVLTLLSMTPIVAETSIENVPEKTYSQYLIDAVNSVENAKKDALDALDKMVKKVDSEANSDPETTNSISTKIVETHALGEMAKNTADVEIAKTKAIAQISQAVDNIDNAGKEDRERIKEESFATIVQAIASVEIAKTNATKNILQATQKVEVSKATPAKKLEHAEETLSIAKNIAAVQIAQSVANVEVARSNSLIEMARSSIKNMTVPLSKKDEEKLKQIKAEATARISSYLTKLEILKAELSAKIAQEIVKVELAETKMKTASEK